MLVQRTLQVLGYVPVYRVTLASRLLSEPPRFFRQFRNEYSQISKTAADEKLRIFSSSWEPSN